MANIQKVARLILGLGSLMGTALPANSAAATTMNVIGVAAEVPPECIATSYTSYQAVVAKCATSVLKDISVPVGGQIVLTGLNSKTVRLTLLRLHLHGLTHRSYRSPSKAQPPLLHRQVAATQPSP